MGHQAMGRQSRFAPAILNRCSIRPPRMVISAESRRAGRGETVVEGEYRVSGSNGADNVAPSQGFASLVFCLPDLRVVYAGFAVPPCAYSNDPGYCGLATLVGVHQSTDGGTTWQAVRGEGLGLQNVSRARRPSDVARHGLRGDRRERRLQVHRWRTHVGVDQRGAFDRLRPVARHRPTHAIDASISARRRGRLQEHRQRAPRGARPARTESQRGHSSGPRRSDRLVHRVGGRLPKRRVSVGRCGQDVGAGQHGVEHAGRPGTGDLGGRPDALCGDGRRRRLPAGHRAGGGCERQQLDEALARPRCGPRRGPGIVGALAARSDPLIVRMVRHTADGTATIAGVVRDESGPVRDAIVTGQATSLHTSTDARGEFVLAGADAGRAVDPDRVRAGLLHRRPGLGHARPPQTSRFNWSGTPRPTTRVISGSAPRGRPVRPPTARSATPEPGRDDSLLPYDEWVRDAHGTSAVNPRFLSVYNGTDLSGAHRSPAVRVRHTEGLRQIPASRPTRRSRTTVLATARRAADGRQLRRVSRARRCGQRCLLDRPERAVARRAAKASRATCATSSGPSSSIAQPGCPFPRCRRVVDGVPPPVTRPPVVHRPLR